MDQLSMPYRIALGALLAVVLVWAVALRGGGEDESATAPLPGEGAVPTASAQAGAADPGSGPLGAVDKARDASATSDAANAKIDAASGGGGTAASPAPAAATPATAPATAPAQTTSKPAPPTSGADAKVARLESALEAGKVVVLLFWDRTAAEDREARRALERVDRRDGDVVTAAAPVDDVGRYEDFTAEVKVNQTPSILVISPKRTARLITGFTDATEIDQAVGDALRVQQ